MSSNCAGLPSSFDRFGAIWHIDFEYRIDANHLPVPVALFAKEHRSGAEIALRRLELLALRRAPFDVGPDTLVTSYSIVAELSCFRVLNWPMPARAVCSYFETAAQINGLDLVGLQPQRPRARRDPGRGEAGGLRDDREAERIRPGLARLRVERG